ncbi:MAG: cytochrome P450 [Acidimicrobiaceae bacterium]|nr:cytochrome P450 [Acidimicrobiia bacterium]MCY4495174.1 cytochrome P450 [Acidimicrobiaceae bacterium]
MSTDTTPETLALHRPETYADQPPHDLFTRLRREEPVVFQEMDGAPGYWAVLRHADVMHVAKHPEIFSANEGGVVIEDLDPPSLAQMRDMLLAMDPPRHTAYRRPISPEFKARVIGAMEDRIRTITTEILDRAEAMGPEVEFVHDVCAHLPSQVVGELMGLPGEDWPAIHAMAERNSGGQDPDISAKEDRGSSSVDMAMYGMAFAAKRRNQPLQGDLTDLLLGTEFDGKLMTDVDFGRFFVQLVTAGNDTTRTMLSGGLLALLQHPDQMQMLRDDPSLLPKAVEEILRWANPLHYFRRTALVDTELGGKSISAGDKVAMIYTSANRDEAVFDDPQAFDITRDPNHHLSFGFGTHFCLGVHLARLEGRVFFDEVLKRWSGIELTGEPRRQQSNLNNSLKHLPVRLLL